MTACELCKGACCEGFYLKISDTEHGRWLRYHGKVINDMVYIPAKCNYLNKKGKCDIYETRPEPCRRYEVGGPACRQTVKWKRSNWKQIFSLFNNKNEV